MSTQTPSPELIRLKKQAIKRFHPDNAVDKEDEIRLTRLMQEANAAFDARDEERLRAVFAPPQPAPPQPPPNAWGPRTYPGAQQAQQTTAQAPPQAATQPAQPAQVSTSFKAWFWITWGGWSVVCLVLNNGWMIVVGLFASLFIANYLVKIQRFIERTFGKKTPPQQAAAGQAVPSGPQYPGWHPWFWGTWITCGLLGLAIGQIGKTGTTLNDTATLTGIWYFLGGIPLAFILAWYRDRIKQWLAAQHAAGPQGHLGKLVAFIAVFIFLTMIPVMDMPIGVTSRTSSSPAPASTTSAPAPAANRIVTGDAENNYAQGIIRAVGSKFAFKDLGEPMPPKGAAVEMKFQIGPTGYPNAASVVTSSGYRALDWSCTQAVDHVGNFGSLPASANGGNISVFYRCVYNEPDTITKIAVVPVASSTAMPFEQKFGWYVESVKTKVAQNWYLKEVAESVPGGSTVYVQFLIDRNGHSSNVSLHTSSSWNSLDQSCLNAVKRVDTFGPLPAGYKEKSLNVLYHCTYPGRSSTSGEASGHGASVLPESTSIAAKPLASQEWHGTYTGTVHNNNIGLDADISVILAKPINAAIIGYFNVKPPLYGSGPLTGTNVTNDAIEFHVVPAQRRGFELDFKGRRTGPGTITGTYTVSSGQTGTFTMYLQSTQIGSAQEPEPFDNGISQGARDTEMTEYDTKTRGLIQRFFETWPTAFAPVGTFALADVTVKNDGTPGQARLVATSRWQAIDSACVAAASQVPTFGRLPAWYAGSRSVRYKCTVRER